MSGYCSDIFTTAAIDFVSARRRPPLLRLPGVQLPARAPRGPRGRAGGYQKDGPLARRRSPARAAAPRRDLISPADDIARVYAMVTNIDTNVGRILAALESRGLAENTIVVFLTDNGPAKVRFNAGLRGCKGTVYEGGIRVPCYIRWPGHFAAGRVVDRMAAHIDLFPTLLEACRVARPGDCGSTARACCRSSAATRTSIGPIARCSSSGTAATCPSRTARSPPDRSATSSSGPRRPPAARKPPSWSSTTWRATPGRSTIIAAEQPQLVERMHAEYLAWFRDVSSTRGFDPVRIDIGGPREDPTILTRQDWRGPRAGWGPNDLGHWEVDVVRGGRFTVDLRLTPRRFPTVAHLSLGGVERSLKLDAGAAECTFADVPWTAGPAAWRPGSRATATRPACWT